MSQYGRVNPNYYQPLAKFNTIRLIYKYVNFNALDGIIDGWCLFNLIYFLSGSYSPPELINGSCNYTSIPSDVIGTKVINNDPIESCVFTGLEPLNLIGYKVNFIYNTVTNSCSVNATNGAGTPIPPTNYTPGLFQATINGHCIFNINDRPMATPILLANLDEINDSCTYTTILSAIIGTPIINVSAINSCLTEDLGELFLPATIQLSTRIINITGSCEINA